VVGCGGRIVDPFGDGGGPEDDAATSDEDGGGRDADAGVDAGRDAGADANAPDVFSPPPGCPRAATLRAGMPCSSSGELCPGNPLTCDGIVDYDALQCDGTAWVTVAATVCGDGGGD
jgi:hypothetical protein